LPDFFKAVTAARFGAMAGIAAVLTAFFLYLAGAITEPPKTVLFSGLESRDAAAVSAKLDSMSVKYDVKEGGTILVPADQVTKLRMAMAQSNLPAAGVGYEIFDKSDTFGTTAFVQNINRSRALEGELARSIQTIEGVQSARVHLVVPERQVFAREDQSPSASVVVKTGSRLDRGQVGAIQHLVAAAVPAMTPSRVAIVDDRGNLLAGGDDTSGPQAMARDQDQNTSDYEESLRQRIETIVGSVVGAGHVRAQVTADINYNHTTTTAESYDPDSKVIRSTQTVEQNSSDTSSNGNAVSVANALPGGAQAAPGEGQKSNSGRTEETTNYEISKTVKTSTVDGGEIKRISVAVVVDGTGDTAAAYKPRTPAEMTQITNIVRSAMGFDQNRGDQVQVTNMPFARITDPNAGTPAPEPLLGLDSGYWFKIIEAAIFCVTALLLGLFVARPMIKRMFTPLTAADVTTTIANVSPVAGAIAAPGQAQAAPGATLADGSPTALAAPRESMIDVSRIEGQVRESSIKKVGEVVSAHPDEALAIIRTWLHEPA
jgi:flagellar M-ring protein FliF